MKKKTTKRRRSHTRGLSSGSPRKRRRRGLRDGGSKLKTSAVDSLLGGAGGAGAYFVNKAISGFKVGTVGKVLLGFGVGLGASYFGAPKIGIGFSGGSTALAMQAGLGDDSNANFADEDSLEEGEVYQTNDGDYVRMLNDGTTEYLSDEEVEALNDSYSAYPDYSMQHNL